jgi:hypothetical protein
VSIAEGETRTSLPGTQRLRRMGSVWTVETIHPISSSSLKVVVFTDALEGVTSLTVGMEAGWLLESERTLGTTGGASMTSTEAVARRFREEERTSGDRHDRHS